MKKTKLTHPGTKIQKERALVNAAKVIDGEPDEKKKTELLKDLQGLKERYEAELKRSKDFSIRVLNRYHFNSKLQRMSTIVELKNEKTGKLALDSGNYVLTKGSPEMIFKLLKNKNAEFEKKYDEVYRNLAEQGQRVLALAYRKIAGSNFDKVTRDDAESSLIFAGFAMYKCETRKDSRLVIKSLNDSAHKCIMLTGDAALTGFSVAKEVEICKKSAKTALILEDDGKSFHPARKFDNDIGEESIKIDDLDEQLPDLARNSDLIITGKGLQAALDLYGDKFNKHFQLFSVFARLSPQQKEDIIRIIGGYVYNEKTRTYEHSKDQEYTLMCGDDGNDVGALKQADVGLALLSGFGNANVDVKEKKEKPPSLLDNIFGSDNRDTIKENEQELAEFAGYSESSAEQELERIRQADQKKAADAAKKVKDEFTRKQKGKMAKQQQYMQEEIERRQRAGEFFFKGVFVLREGIILIFCARIKLNRGQNC